MSQITEAKLYEEFGLSEKVQEVAGPAGNPQQEDTARGANEQVIADPAAEETNTGADAGTEPGAGTASPDEPEHEAEGGTAPEQNQQTPQQRHEYAARRRQQELQAAIDDAVAAARQQMQRENAAKMDEIFARAGLVDSTTGEPIKTLEQFEQWYQGFQNAKIEQKLKRGKLTRDVLDQLISEHPTVKKAEEAVRQFTDAEAKQRAQAEQTRINGQLAEIAKLNPEIKGLADILQMPTAEAFRANVEKGMDFLDAYRLANMDAIAEGKAQRARQAAQTNERGKEHLVSTGNARGGGSASVPPDQLRLYRMMNPRATDAQIQAHFNKYLSSQGG